MRTTRHFRGVILAALGLTALGAPGCGDAASQGGDGAALDGGLQDTSDPEDLASDLDQLSDADALDLVDGAAADISDGALLDVADAQDVPDGNGKDLPDIEDFDVPDEGDVCVGAVRCYSAASVKAAGETSHCGSKECQLPWQDTTDDVKVCTPTEYNGPLPPQGCPSGWMFTYHVCEGFSEGWVKGDECCYTFCATCQCGRPLWLEGELRVAEVVLDTRARPRPDADPALHAIAAAWRADAQEEHAAIASLHRLGLELMGAGAPSELLAAAAAGARDEVAHVQACLGLAREIDGQEAALGPLNLAGFTLRSDLTELAVAAVLEGCIGETLAALRAATAAQLAGGSSPGAKHQQRIAQDELGHAALAWRVVQWALQQQPAAAAAVQQAFAAAVEAGPPADPRSASLTGIEPAVLHYWGRLTEAETRRSDAAALREVVAVCAQALFAGLEGASAVDLRDLGRVAV